MAEDITNTSNHFTGDGSGQVVQVGVVHGDLRIHTEPARPETAVWVSVFLGKERHKGCSYDEHSRTPVGEVRLFVEAFTAQAVILRQLRPVITRRIDKDEYDFYRIEVGNRAFSQRKFEADLGRPKPASNLPRPTLYYAGIDNQKIQPNHDRSDQEKDFPYYVTASDPEHIVIRPTRYDGSDELVEWHLELDWSCLGQHGTAVINDDGAPFVYVRPGVPLRDLLEPTYREIAPRRRSIRRPWPKQ